VEIGFATAETAMTYSSLEAMTARWGSAVARCAAIRLLQLEAAGTFGDARRLPQLHVHQLRRSRRPRIGIDLVEGLQIVADLADADMTTTVSDGGWDRCRMVEVVAIEAVDDAIDREGGSIS
jgi:hypothetical protein